MHACENLSPRFCTFPKRAIFCSLALSLLHPVASSGLLLALVVGLVLAFSLAPKVVHTNALTHMQHNQQAQQGTLSSPSRLLLLLIEWNGITSSVPTHIHSIGSQTHPHHARSERGLLCEPVQCNTWLPCNATAFAHLLRESVRDKSGRFKSHKCPRSGNRAH